METVNDITMIRLLLCCFSVEFVFFKIMALLSCLNSEESNYYNSPRKYMDICATFPCYNARLIKEYIFSIGLPEILVIPHNVEAENFN